MGWAEEILRDAQMPYPSEKAKPADAGICPLCRRALDDHSFDEHGRVSCRPSGVPQ